VLPPCLVTASTRRQVPASAGGACPKAEEGTARHEDQSQDKPRTPHGPSRGAFLTAGKGTRGKKSRTGGPRLSLAYARSAFLTGPLAGDYMCLQSEEVGVRARLVRIGNSRGLRLPKAADRRGRARRQRSTSSARRTIVIRPVGRPRVGWAEAPAAREASTTRCSTRRRRRGSTARSGRGSACRRPAGRRLPGRPRPDARSKIHKAAPASSYRRTKLNAHLRTFIVAPMRPGGIRTVPRAVPVSREVRERIVPTISCGRSTRSRLVQRLGRRRASDGGPIAGRPPGDVYAP